MVWWFPPEVQFEFVPCDYCGAESYEVLFEGPDRLHYLPGIFRVVRCLGCGWIRQNPRPTFETIGYYYPNEYANFRGAIEEETSIWRQWDRRYGMWKRRRAIEHLQPNGRLLDVGCATGVFLNEMRNAGWDVIGIEPNREASKYAREHFGVPVYTGTLRDMCLPGASFDVITMWDVLEHLHTPWLDLKEASRLLKEGGLLVIRIPNLESLEAQLFGPLWVGWDLPRHLYLFPRKALTVALEQLGFRIEAIRCFATSHAAFVLSLKFYLENRCLWFTRRPYFIQRVGNAVPMRAILGPLFWILDRALLSSLITFFARKVG